MDALVLTVTVNCTGREMASMEKLTNLDHRTSPLQIDSERELRRKVIIRYVDGSLLRGYLSPEDGTTFGKNEMEPFVVEDEGGHSQEVRPSQIKAIFFVKTFDGSPNYSEFKVFSNRPSGRGVWIRVEFGDGEVMEGIAPNSLATYFNSAFSMTPPDPASNNLTVLVSKRSLRDMQVLGLAAD